MLSGRTQVIERHVKVKILQVLLLEAGGQEPLAALAPSFYRAFWNDERFDWNYRTVPADYCLDQGGLGCNWPRGKVLGK